jgi:probable phosphoglycerate mutase
VKRYIGQKDTILNDCGREQALWWKKKLSTIPFLSAYSSELLRSRETLHIITEGRTYVSTALPDLREISVWNSGDIILTQLSQLGICF